MKRKLKMAEIASEFIGAPYKLGGKSRKEGFDCLSLILAIGKRLGFSVPDFFDGFDYDSYPKLWLSDEKKAKRIMIRLVSELGSRVKPNFAFTPDILLLRSDGNTLVGIHAGRDLFLSSFVNVGVELEHIRKYSIIGAYRWADGKKKIPFMP